MKGQLDISFQWIYVILAGGAFLLIFFFAYRALTDSEEQRNDAIGLRSAATMYTTAVWQPDAVKNLTVHADVSCIGGTLALSRGSASWPVPAPVFMPPVLSGRTIAVSREIARGETGTPKMPFGSVLYVIDENTYYYTIGDIDMPAGARVRKVAGADIRGLDIPDGAKTAIIVVGKDAAQDVDPEKIALPKTGATLYGVDVRDGIATFYRQNGASLKETAGITYVGDELMVGAAIAGTPENYRCAKGNFVERARDIVSIYSLRSEMLIDGGIAQSCAGQHAIALDILDPSLDDDGLLAAIDDDMLLTAQSALYDLHCPVIA